MPNRVIREALLESEPWLSVKDNTDRVCYTVVQLTCDTLGNMTAGPQRLVKLWRPYGVETPERAAQVVGSLCDVDLLRRYEVDGKPFLHVPRFNQSRRFLGTLNPLSPWQTEEEKQRVARKSRVNHQSTLELHGASPEPSGDRGKASTQKQGVAGKSRVNHASPPVTHGDSPLGVGVGVGVGVGLGVKPLTPRSVVTPETAGNAPAHRSAINAEKQTPAKAEWFKTPKGIEQEAKLRGVKTRPGESHAQLKKRVNAAPDPRQRATD